MDTTQYCPGCEGKAAELAALQEHFRQCKQEAVKQNNEICQMLGKALGYPQMIDDQATFPGATKADGVCVGEHIAVTLAREVATEIAALQKRIVKLKDHNMEFRIKYENLLHETTHDRTLCAHLPMIHFQGKEKVTLPSKCAFCKMVFPSAAYLASHDCILIQRNRLAAETALLRGTLENLVMGIEAGEPEDALDTARHLLKGKGRQVYYYWEVIKTPEGKVYRLLDRTT